MLNIYCNTSNNPQETYKFYIETTLITLYILTTPKFEVASLKYLA